jgi:hypothetical protein
MSALSGPSVSFNGLQLQLEHALVGIEEISCPDPLVSRLYVENVPAILLENAFFGRRY